MRVRSTPVKEGKRRSSALWNDPSSAQTCKSSSFSTSYTTSILMCTNQNCKNYIDGIGIALVYDGGRVSDLTAMKKRRPGALGPKLMRSFIDLSARLFRAYRGVPLTLREFLPPLAEETMEGARRQPGQPVGHRRQLLAELHLVFRLLASGGSGRYFHRTPVGFSTLLSYIFSSLPRMNKCCGSCSPSRYHLFILFLDLGYQHVDEHAALRSHLPVFPPPRRGEEGRRTDPHPQ